MAIVVRDYLTLDFTDLEKKSYLEYVSGNENSTDWIEKALEKREKLLLLNLKCKHKTNKGICNEWVSIRETGVCICSNNHTCYDVVLPVINKLK